MNTIIRRATTDDFPFILSLIKEFSVFQKSEDKVSISLEQMNSDKDIFQCFVAETAGKEIVGFASFFYAYYSWSGKAIYLDDLYVRESFRKRKIGEQLLNAVIELAKNSSCKKVRWLVSRWNSNAVSFYKKMGAAVDDTEMVCDLALQ